MNCQSVHECQNGGVTDPVLGDCQCNLGWTGDNCERGKIYPGKGTYVIYVGSC